MSVTLRRRNRKSSRRAYRAIRIPYGAGAQEPAATPRNHSGRRRRPAGMGAAAECRGARASRSVRISRTAAAVVGALDDRMPAGSARRLRRVRATSRQLVSEYRRGGSSGARVSDESCVDPDVVTAPRPRTPRWRWPSANSASAPAPAERSVGAVVSSAYGASPVQGRCRGVRSSRQETDRGHRPKRNASRQNYSPKRLLSFTVITSAALWPPDRVPPLHLSRWGGPYG